MPRNLGPSVVGTVWGADPNAQDSDRGVGVDHLSSQYKAMIRGIGVAAIYLESGAAYGLDLSLVIVE